MARPKGPRGGQMDAAAELWHMSIRDLTTKNSQARYNGAIDTQIYEIQEKYSDALNSLELLLNINKEDFLILCYYGEILFKLKRYDEAVSYFTRAICIDPENIHILSKRAITYKVLEKYKEAFWLNEKENFKETCQKFNEKGTLRKYQFHN